MIIISYLKSSNCFKKRLTSALTPHQKKYWHAEKQTTIKNYWYFCLFMPTSPCWCLDVNGPTVLNMAEDLMKEAISVQTFHRNNSEKMILKCFYISRYEKDLSSMMVTQRPKLGLYEKRHHLDRRVRSTAILRILNSRNIHEIEINSSTHVHL